MKKKHTNTDATAELPPVDDYANATEALSEKMVDALTPGFQIELDPDEAARMGAFVEDALSEHDAQESAEDLAELDEQEERPTFLDDQGPLADSPPFITTSNIREMYGWRPGETLQEAIARKKKEG